MPKPKRTCSKCGTWFATWQPATDNYCWKCRRQLFQAAFDFFKPIPPEDTTDAKD